VWESLPQLSKRRLEVRCAKVTVDGSLLVCRAEREVVKVGRVKVCFGAFRKPQVCRGWLVCFR
jgi:hypothetical protein